MGKTVRERFNPKDLPKPYDQFRAAVREQLRALERVVKVLSLAVGDVAAEADVGVTDLTTVRLTGNAELTLSIEGHISGDRGVLELTQDGTGGRVPTWLNATGTNDAIAAPAAGAGKKTMYLCVYNGAEWVLSVLATNY